MNLACSRYTANIESGALPDLVCELFTREYITNGDSPEWFEKSVNLIEHDLLISSRDEVDDTVANDAVDSRVRQRNGSDRAIDESHVGGIDALAVFVCLVEHGL